MQNLEIFSLSWVFVMLAVLFAAYVRGTAGFGFALILAPILLLIMDPRSVVVINLLLGVLGNIYVLLFSFRSVNLRRIVPIIAGSLFGIPVGIYIINLVDPATLKILIGAVIIFFIIPLILGFSRPFLREKQASLVTGFTSGILAGSTSLSGPPVVIFMHNQDWQKAEVHSGLAAYFLFVSSAALVGLALTGLINAQLLISTASLIPSIIIGTGLGIVTFRKINVSLFRRITMLIVLCTGILGILSGLGVISWS